MYMLFILVSNNMSNFIVKKMVVAILPKQNFYVLNKIILKLD